MTILLLTDGIAPFVMGGMQKHSRLIAEYLARLGHKITLFHYSDKHVTEDEVRFHFSDQANKNIEFHHFIYTDKSRIPGHYLRAQRAMSELYLKKFNELHASFDFIYTKGFMGWAMLEQKAELNIATPIGVKFHGMNMFQKQPNLRGEFQKYLFRGRVRWIMKRSDFVFSYGGKITDVIISQGIQRNKILEVPSGIESNWVTENIVSVNDEIGFLFVGRYDRLKGLPELYDAIAKLKTLRPWKLTIVGPIPETKKIPHSNISYVGSVEDTNTLRKLYDENDVLLNPSISEGMPNVILEAMARGLAIVASDVGASSLLVTSNNGILIEPGSSLSIKVALEEMCDLPLSKLNEMKAASLCLIKERYTWVDLAPVLQRTLERHSCV